MFPRTENVGAKSVFKLPITNALGLDKSGSYNLLKVKALKDPVTYATDRQKLFETVVSQAVEANYNLVWAVLAEGKIIDETGTQVPVKICGADFNPSVPAIEVAEIAGTLAKSVMSAWEDIFEKILPDSFSKIADEKLKASTVIEK